MEVMELKLIKHDEALLIKHDEALRDVPLAGHFITFSLCFFVARIDTPPLQPAALAFVSYGFVLIRV